MRRCRVLGGDVSGDLLLVLREYRRIGVLRDPLLHDVVGQLLVWNEVCRIDRDDRAVRLRLAIGAIRAGVVPLDGIDHVLIAVVVGVDHHVSNGGDVSDRGRHSESLIKWLDHMVGHIADEH